LADLRERVQINRRLISAEEFLRNANQVLTAEARLGMLLTYFEFDTAMMFLAFAEQKVDIAILETGLGGRWDATNIIRHPDVTIITSIGHDHTEWLGRTKAAIALQKAGIIKRGCSIISGVTGIPGTVIAQEASRRHAPLRQAGRDFRTRPVR